MRRQPMDTAVVVAVLCLAFAAGRGIAEEVEVPTKDVDVYRMAGKVTLDGKLDEAAWSELPEYTGFRWKDAPDIYAGIQSAFQVGYDDQTLYVSIRAEEPRMREHLEAARKKDTGTGKADWGYQLMEVFISPPTGLGPQPFQFAVDILGHKSVYRARLDGAAYEYGKTKWEEVADIPWDTAVSTGNDAYAMEIRIPFASLGSAAKAGEKWKLHIGRHGTWTMDGLHWKVCTWSAMNPVGWWRMVDKHGDMQFMGSTVEIGRAGVLTDRINKDYVAWKMSDKDTEALLARTKGKTNLLEKIDGNRLLLNGDGGAAALMKRERSLAMPQVFLVEWETPMEFNCHRIDWTNPMVYGSAYALEYWDGGEWKLAYQERNHRGVRSCHIFPTVKANKVRLTVVEHTPNRWFWMKLADFGLFLVDESAAAK